MEVTIRGLSEKSLKDLQNEFRKSSCDYSSFKEEENYYTVAFFCEGVCVLKNTIMVMIQYFGLIHLEITRTDYQDIEIR